MTWKKTVILGLIFLCAAAGYFADRSLTKRRQLVKEREEALLPIKKEDVTAFTLINPSGTFRLEKEGGKWDITKPRRLNADQDQVESLLTNIGAARQYDPVEKKDLAQYGLDKPAISITLENSATKEKSTLLAGVESTTRGRFFATLEGGKTVFTITSHIKTSLEKNLYHLRDKNILKVKKEEIQSVGIYRGKEITLIEKESGGRWVLKTPVRDETDTDTLSNFLSSIATIRAASFEDDRPSTPGFYGLKEPLMTFSVRTDRPTTMLLGREDAPNERFFARLDGSEQVFTIPKSFVVQLTLAHDSLRSRTIFKVREDELTEIKIIIGESYANIERGANGVWRFKGEAGRLVNQGRVRRLIADLYALRILTFEDEHPASLAPYGLESPRCRIILYPANHTRREILSFGNKPEGKDIAYATASRRPLVFGVEWTKVGDFYLTRHDLEDRRIFRLEGGAIQRIEIAIEGKIRALEREGERWFLKSEGEAGRKEVPNFKAAGVLGSILSLEYDKEISEPSGIKPPAPEKPAVRIALYAKDKNLLDDLSAASTGEQSVTVWTAGGKLYLIKKPDLQNILSSFNALAEKESERY